MTTPTSNEQIFMSFQKKLLPFQEEAVKLMSEKEVASRTLMYASKVGLLSNPPGTGKTLTTLALFQMDKYKNGSPSQENRGGWSCILSNLVVVPTTIMWQWVSEIATTEMTVFIIDSKRKLAIFNQMSIQDRLAFDIFLCCNTFYNDFGRECHGLVKWKRVVIDEAAVIRRLNFVYIFYDFMWLVSSTPLSSRGTDFISCHIVESNSIKNYTPVEPSQRAINKYFLKAAANRFSSPSFFRFSEIFPMIENSDYSGLKNILKCGVETDQTFLSKCVELSSERYLSIKQKVENIKEDTCAICFDNYSTPCISKCCKAITCTKCVLTGMINTNKCPFCRAPMKKEELTLIVEEEEVSEGLLGSSPEPSENRTSFELCLKIIKENPSKKFIIYDTVTSYICRFLEQNSIYPLQIKGQWKSVQRLMGFFNSETHGISIITLNRKTKLEGCDFKKVTDIIFLCKPSSNVEEYLINRVYNNISREDETLSIHYID